MKLGKYIFVKIPAKAEDIHFSLPYNNLIWYGLPELKKFWNEWHTIECKHLKPNTGIRYEIHFR